MEAGMANQGTSRIPRRSTLLDLLAIVNEQTPDDTAAARRVVALVNSGRVMLTGNFRGVRFPVEVVR
jgi:hypothetical protein